MSCAAGGVGVGGRGCCGVGVRAAPGQQFAPRRNDHNGNRGLPIRPHTHATNKRVHDDGETITVALPKEEASGAINNQLESLTFKVCVRACVCLCAQRGCMFVTVRPRSTNNTQNNQHTLVPHLTSR